ncbi:hypothetical protein JCM5350_000933 [Sporobolomyces pararoseus]
MTSGSSSNILILQRDSKRVAVALPPTLDLALSAASQHFPSLLRPLYLTRNLPEFGGDVEITESVWQTSWIQGHQFLTLDVHESDFQIQEEEEVKPKKRIKLEEPEQKLEKVSTQVGSNRGSKEATRSLSPLVQQEVKSPNPPSNPDLPQTFETLLPSPPCSRGGHSLSPPVEPTLIPSVVPPDKVHVKLVFRPPVLPEMYFDVQRSVKMIKILSKVADLYGVDRFRCYDELRLLYDGQRLISQTAADLFDYDELGTVSSPLVVELFAGLGGPVVQEDYDRYCKGEPLPEYRDAILRTLKPLPTDPYLPKPPLPE